MPSLFALLADPSVIVDGLDSVLGEVQNLLQGQIFGVKLPLLGDLLNDNPVSNLVGQIRSKLLQPLANLLRENNVGFDGLKDPDPVEALRRLRARAASTSSSSSTAAAARRRRATSTSSLLKNDGAGQRARREREHLRRAADRVRLQARQVVHATPRRRSISTSASRRSASHASFTPQVTLSFGLNFGFGVDVRQRLLLRHRRRHARHEPTTDETELTVGALVTLSSVNCPGGTVDRAQVNGDLLFLALHLTDGVDLRTTDRSRSTAPVGLRRPRRTRRRSTRRPWSSARSTSTASST